MSNNSEIQEEEILLEDIFLKFKQFNIDIGLVCNDEQNININSYNKNYVLILTNLFDDECDLIDLEEKEIILDKCLEIYDELDIIGFKGGLFKITMNKEKNIIKQYLSNITK